MLAAVFVGACSPHSIKGGLPVPSNTDPKAAPRFSNPEAITLVRGTSRPDPINRVFPKYPSGLERNRKSGAAIVAYVIDTTGHIELGTASFLNVRYRAFADAVCDFLPKLRYAPFVVGERKQRILIVQTHLFMVSRDPNAPEIADAKRLHSRSEEEFAKIPIIAVVDTLRKLPHCAARQP